MNNKGHIYQALKIALTAMILICLAISAQAQFVISGELSSDSVLSPANNPYIVPKDIIVDPGVTLTLLPGVKMAFEYGTKIICSGTLISKGTPNNPILLYPKNPSSSAGQWYGILLENAVTNLDQDGNYESGSIVAYTSFSKAYIPITLSKGTSVLVENVTIIKCILGIYLEEATRNIIRNCSVSQSDISGIYFTSGYHNSNNSITGNTISECSEMGIFINNRASLSRDNMITNNHIHHCNTGIQIGDVGYQGPGNNKVLNNYLHNNIEGLGLYHDSTLVKYNMIVRNTNGLVCSGSNSDSILNNLFFENSLEAITLTAGSSGNYLSNNTAAYNHTGIWIQKDADTQSLQNRFQNNTLQNQQSRSFIIEDAPQLPLTGNNILDNGSFQSFENASSGELDATQDYWGVNTTQAIDSIIYDKRDQNSLGSVTYVPYLILPEVKAPIPAPSHAIKQQIGDDVIVSWKNVASADLAAYSVSFGKNDGVVYANRVLNGKLVFRNMGNFPILDTIAITTLSTKADARNDQVEGNESSYVYAILTPYAGPDTAICKNSTYEIVNSTAVASTSLLWTTTGDGHFSEPAQLHPIYFPGTNDYLNGEVFLRLSANTAGNDVNDFAHIKFYDPPMAFAGADTTISIDTTLQLAGARASEFQKLEWKTSGDGTFDLDNILKPVYKPGVNDTAAGTVKLWITSYNICGSATDTLTVSIDRGFSVSGTVKAGFLPAVNSSLELYMNNSKSNTLMRKSKVAANGTFSFHAVLEGEYYLYAIPDASLDGKYLPTYFFNRTLWEIAPRMIVKGETGDVDIELQPVYNLPAGQGSISGFCANENQSCGDVTILLYDKLNKYAFRWARSSGAGSFSFTGLPYGTYLLAGVKTGIPVFYSQQIIISPSNPDAIQIELHCTPTMYKFSVPAQYLSQGKDTDLRIYPNPCSDRLSIDNIPGKGSTQVRLINSQGVVYNFLVSDQTGTENILDLRAVPAGLYIVEVCTDGACLVRKKLVKH